MQPGWRDLGDGVEIAEYTEPGHDGPAGLLWRHDCPADPRGPESGGDSVPVQPAVAERVDRRAAGAADHQPVGAVHSMRPTRLDQVGKVGSSVTEPDPASDEALGIRDIGHGVKIMLTSRVGYDTPVGLIESHPGVDGVECSGAVLFDVPGREGLPGARWHVESWEPLTISPSVLCRTCGHHGFIRSGRWVPA